MAGKLVPVCIHLSNDCVPCWCGVNGTLAVVDSRNEESGLCAEGIQKIHNLVGVDAWTIIVCQGNITRDHTVIEIRYRYIQRVSKAEKYLRSLLIY